MVKSWCVTGAAPSDMGDRIEATVPGDLLVEAAARREAHSVDGCRRVHSWTADGRRVCWQTRAASAAVDAEQWTATVPEPLARRWPLPQTEFWTAWTRAEVHAKLLDTPILTWLSRVGLGGPDVAGVRTMTHHLDDLVVTVGYLESAPEPADAGRPETQRVPR